MGNIGPILQKSYSFLKKVFLTIIGRYQHLQCITACCVWGCIETHADLCPLLNAPTMAMCLSELDHGAMEEGDMI